MSRRPPPPPPAPPLHLVRHGRGGADCFVHAANYWAFLTALRTAAADRACAVHAYVLLPDRFELLVTPAADGDAGRMLARVGAAYVRTFNASTGRRGPLWRPGATRTIDTVATLLDTQRRIELAPVAAGLVTAPGHYRWSSYRHNALGDLDPLIAPHAHWLRLARSDADRRQRWQALVADGGSAPRA